MSLLLLLKGGDPSALEQGYPDRRRRIPSFNESRIRMPLGTDDRRRFPQSTDERRRMTDENVS